MTEEPLPTEPEAGLDELVWNAMKALLTASPLGDDVYAYGEVPGETGNDGVLPDAFVLLSLQRRYVEPREAGRTTITGWRASVRYVDTTAVNARRVGGWVSTAFETRPGYGRRITVNGVESTPITHESTTDVSPDDGRYSGLSHWTFAL